MTWFEVGTPATFGSPANTSIALTFGAPDPTAPEGLGNLGNFIYVGTSPTASGSKGQVYVSRDAGGTWANISLGLDGSPVQQIITDPARGSHDAYAVTTTGVFYLQNSILLAQNPTNTQYEWVNITGNLKALAYSLFGQGYNPTTDANSAPYNLTTVLNSIAANWDYTIPNNPAGPHARDITRCSTSPATRASTCQPTTARPGASTPSTTYGAVTPGGDLPHVNVTDLSLSQGNVAVATGMPALAGPYQTFIFTGTLTAGSTTVAGITDTSGLAAGDVITGTGIPAGTTITAVNKTTDSLTLSTKATASGSQALSAANPTATPDPDLLLAGTYGEGAFAINLAPMLMTGTTQIDPTDTRRDRRRRHPDRHDRHAHHRRPQRDHRLRQRHLGQDRRRDAGRLDLRAGHRRVRPAGVRARPVDHARLEQLDRHLRQLRHPAQPGVRLQLHRRSPAR